MSKIEDLIRQFCPDGVEWRTIESLTKSICSGLNPRRNFSLNVKGADCNYLTVKEMASGKIVFSDKTDKITKEAVGIIQNRSRLEFGDILLSGIGTIGRVAIVDIPVGDWNCSESVLLLKADQTLILPKYLKYILEGNEVQVYFNTHATGSTLKGIRQKDLRSLEIPVPPLPVQEEIVRILDNFTNLAAELQAELQARQEQYQYYRDTLLSFEGRTDVEWKKLGEIATLIRGGNFQKKDFTDSGVPCIHYGQIYTHFGIHTTSTIKYITPEVARKSKIAKTNDIVMAITSENVEDVGKCVAWLGDDDIAVSGHTAIIQHKQNAKYLSYYFHTSHFFTQKKRLAHGTKVIEISPKALADVLVPIPPLAEQQRIVDILDRFDKLTTDITAGLPAEIEARRKQYEYYRDRLLRFKRM